MSRQRPESDAGILRRIGGESEHGVRFMMPETFATVILEWEFPNASQTGFPLMKTAETSEFS